MISKDMSAQANMPQSVIMKPFPGKSFEGMPEYLDDTIMGMDRQIAADKSIAKSQMKHTATQKY